MYSWSWLPFKFPFLWLLPMQVSLILDFQEFCKQTDYPFFKILSAKAGLILLMSFSHFTLPMPTS